MDKRDQLLLIGQRIKSRRVEVGLSQQELADRVGYKSRSSINKIELGKADILQSSLRKIADALHTSPAQILGVSDGNNAPSLPSNIIPIPKTYKVPLVGTIACGQPILAVEEADEAVDVPEWVRADFALRCKGDSMITARIFDGDIVYIRQQEEVETGQIAAVRVGDEATLKKVYYTPGSDRVTLRACNPLYPDMVYEGEALNNIQVLGLAVGFYSEIRHEQ